MGFASIGKTAETTMKTKYVKKSEGCTDESCIQRHPKKCKMFATFQTCRFNEGCAYKHVSEKVNPRVQLLENEIEHLKDGIEFFRENMVELMKRVNSMEPNKSEDNNGRCDKLMKCEKCDYNCKKKGTLQKHMNNKHEARVTNESKQENQNFILDTEQKETTNNISIEENSEEKVNNEVDIQIELVGLCLST